MIKFENENSIIIQKKNANTNINIRKDSFQLNLRHNKTLAEKIPKLITELSKIETLKKKLQSRKKSSVISNPKFLSLLNKDLILKEKKNQNNLKLTKKNENNIELSIIKEKESNIELSIIKEKENDNKEYNLTIYHSPQIKYVNNKSNSPKNKIRKNPTTSPLRKSINNNSILIPEILRKFNLNSESDFNISKKWFLYQLKMSLLQAKKLCVSQQVENSYNDNNSLLNGENNNNNKSNYYDIFTNYSNIEIHQMTSYEKYEDNNIKINNYIIFKNKLLGKGGFSAVYLSQDLENNNREMAVKITEKNSRANRNKKIYDYVKDEIKILRRLHSKYIIEFYDIIESKKDIYIFMEYMKNNSLYNKIKDLTGFQVWRYFRNLICGVEHCHEIGKIIHKDINVNNLLISEDDTVKLSDFGISVIIDNNNDLLPCNGPSTYSPPEKIYNKNKCYHGKSADMWLIGVTLYHMVFKKPLFVNFGNLSENDYKNIDFPDNIDVDPRVTEILLSLLDFDPDKRLSIKDLRKNKWVTHNDEFPLPDVYEEALEYCYELVTKKIVGFNIQKDNYQENKNLSVFSKSSFFEESDY